MIYKTLKHSLPCLCACQEFNTVSPWGSALLQSPPPPVSPQPWACIALTVGNRQSPGGAQLVSHLSVNCIHLEMAQLYISPSEDAHFKKMPRCKDLSGQQHVRKRAWFTLFQGDFSLAQILEQGTAEWVPSSTHLGRQPFPASSSSLSWLVMEMPMASPGCQAPNLLKGE